MKTAGSNAPLRCSSETDEVAEPAVRRADSVPFAASTPTYSRSVRLLVAAGAEMVKPLPAPQVRMPVVVPSLWSTGSPPVHRNSDGLNEEVFDALVLLAAGSWDLRDLASGTDRVIALRQDMDRGRRLRLEKLGFPVKEAEALSALHTRNFM